MISFVPVAESPAIPLAIENRLQHFAPIGLEELQGAALLNRVDTKFLLNEAQLAAIFDRIGDDYRILSIDGVRANPYHTRYVDTPALAMYRDHHNGLRERFKVRTRTYVASNLSFLEVKRKTNRDRTVKARVVVDDPLCALCGERAEFVEAQTPYAAAQLVDILENSFLRVTLVGRAAPERLTIDFSVAFRRGEATAGVPGLVIAEVKQPKFSTRSVFVQQLRALRLEPLGVSKYCLGVLLLCPGVKYNRFKERLLQIDRLTRDAPAAPAALVPAPAQPARPARPLPLALRGAP